MTLLTDEERAKLVALEKEATPGPWRAAAPKGRATGYTSIVEGADGRMALFAGTPFRSDEEIVANCALTVATRNALPALLAADAAVREMREALETFSKAFVAARERYAKRYEDAELGRANFDAMPDSWLMESLTFNMGAFRKALLALSPKGEG